MPGRLFLSFFLLLSPGSALAVFSLAIAMGVVCAADAVAGQNPSTVIRVLDASGVEGIAGVVLLVNPGDARKSQALVTNAQGEAVARDLQCEICTISAFDPQGLFASRTTQFSGSSSTFSLVMQLRPLIDTVGDPKTVSIELLVDDSKGEPLAQRDVVIRPTVMTLENDQVSVRKSDSAGHVSARLRTGDYVVGVLNGDTVSEVGLEIAAAKEQCSSRTASCIVASPQSSRHMKPVSLRLPATSLSAPVHESSQSSTN